MPLIFEKFIQTDRWEVAPQNVSVGPSILGTQQIVATLADHWTARITFIAGLASLSAFRAWKTSRRGRLISDSLGPEREFAGSTDGKSFGAEVLHSDDTAHDDGAGYAQGMSFDQPALLRATRVTLAAPGLAAQFSPGRFLGIGGRLYQITAVPIAGATITTVDIWPPLRGAVSAGEGLNWPPRTPMRLVEDNIAPITDRIGERFDVTIDLQEVV